MNCTRSSLLLALPLLIGMAAGCGSGEAPHTHAGESPTDGHSSFKSAPLGTTLVCVMTPTAGNEVKGTVTFTSVEKGVMMESMIQGLTPGDHAIHIHEFGDIRLPDGKGCGGHYNPEGHDHALPTEGERHAGDLGNLTAGADGAAQYSLLLENVTLDGAENPIIGRSVIIHVGPDDGGQPTGNAGARVAQGVIGYAGKP